MPYVACNKDKAALLHRVIMSAPKGMVVDHINHNTLDNRKCNLRVVTQVENGFNARLSINNTSGTTGVYWNKGARKWEAKIRLKGRLCSLGYFKEKELAIKAAKTARAKFMPQQDEQEHTKTTPPASKESFCESAI